MTSSDSYSDHLCRSYIPHIRQGIWARAGEIPGTQGWKLHVSSIPFEAEQLLTSILPFLRDRQLAFKVARNESVLEGLNSGAMGPTQVGKFVTIYPPEELVREIAEHLLVLTDGFSGPLVPTDLQLGSVLFSRYGGFSPVIVRDRIGRPHRCLRDAEGRLYNDEYSVPHRFPSGISCPFANLGLAGTSESPASSVSPANRLFGPGYLLLDVLHSRPKGAVFLALDLRSQSSVGARVIKQGRKHCMSDRYGRDVRWRLRRELDTHRRLEGVSAVPRAREYFEVEGDGYLVLDYIESRTIESVVGNLLAGRRWSVLHAADRETILRHVADLATAVSAIHERGYVHRDISVTNVQVAGDSSIVLFDLEMAHEVGDSAPTVGLGTIGFIAPSQERLAAPAFSDDVFSVACVIAFAITGIDPRRLLFVDPPLRGKQFLELTGGADEIGALLPVLVRALDSDIRMRANLDEIRGAIDCALIQLRMERLNTRITPAPPRRRSESFEPLLLRAAQGLCDPVLSDAGELWTSLPIGEEDEDSVAPRELAPLRSAYRGVAGVVYLIARLFSMDLCSEQLEQRARGAIAWLKSEAPTADAGMPGLYIGEAGAALALHESHRAGLVENSPMAEDFIQLRLRGALDWYDLTHGAAGQGIAALVCDPSRARRYADFLVASQCADGSWIVPEGLDGLSGKKLSGFAHGVAGIVYFLAEFAFRFEDRAAHCAWLAGADWLLRCAVRDESGAINWPYSDMQPERWKWWCHGAPGIALTFLRLHEITGEPDFLSTAVNALKVHPASISYGNLTQCHGLSGLGEIYLEALRVTQDERWLDRAQEIAITISVLGRETENGGVTWLAGHPGVPTADLCVGSAGLVHFLLRLVRGTEQLGFPLLCGPSTPTGRVAANYKGSS